MPNDTLPEGFGMKLKSLAVSNFRSLAETRLPLHDLNVIVGPNGSGKTALLEVMHLLHCASQRELSKFLDERGGFQAILHRTNGRTQAGNMSIQLELHTSDEESPIEPQNFELTLVDQAVGYVIRKALLKNLNQHNDSKRVSYLDGDPTGETEFSYFAQATGIGASFIGFLAGIHPYGALDVSPRSIVRLPQTLTPIQAPGPNGEHLYSALYNLRISAPEVFERLMILLQQSFPGFRRLELPVVGAGQVTLAWYERDSNTPFYANQLSEGTLRYLWLVTILLAPHRPSLLLLDEPEVSLHPALLRLLAALLQDAALTTQIIVATQSSDLIGWLAPEEVLIADKEDGKTSFTWAADLDLKAWLDEYTLRDLWLMGNLGGRP